MPAPLKIAIQKSGRLSEDSLRLLADCGIRIDGASAGRLKSQAHNFPAEVLFLRDDDIPQYVADGVADIGFVGRNVVAEKAKPVQEVAQLEFGKCRLSLAVKKEVAYEGLESLRGKRIATTYTRILRDYLALKRIEAEIHEISGSVEIAPSIGLADAIFDIVSSGSTLFMNGLKEVETVLHSCAVLVSHPALSEDKRETLGQLLFRIDAVRRSRSHKYILLNAPNDSLEAIIRLLPGMKAPTILPLATEGWSSLHSVIPEDQFWEVIHSLKAAGAQGILVVPIEKMIV